ncbi:hypothetical protein ACVIIZ_004571 [Bradyrhizobium sp. USDA 4523]|nr:hypothetical protein [Bradyrhizobium sp. USDA 4537]MCP1987060.1 hypothetical protein [Bradyrhizobium sp. USDA 4539]
MVLEHGAGYPRDQYAAERFEQAIREKYGVPALPAFARLEAFTSASEKAKQSGASAVIPASAPNLPIARMIFCWGSSAWWNARAPFSRD